MNVYMPGLVNTKILANEPQPLRLVAQLANFLVGVPVSKAGDELARVVDDIATNHRRDVYFARTKLKSARELRMQPDDGSKLWALTQRLLAPWLSVR